MTAAGILGSLPPAAVTGAATWLLHKRGGLPVWQALTAVLLGMIFGPGCVGGPVTALVPAALAGRPWRRAGLASAGRTER